MSSHDEHQLDVVDNGLLQTQIIGLGEVHLIAGQLFFEQVGVDSGTVRLESISHFLNVPVTLYNASNEWLNNEV